MMDFLHSIFGWFYTAPEGVILANPIILPLIMMAAGVAKGISQNAQAARQRKVQAATTRYSPWTGMSASEPQEGDILGGAMSGALAGMMMNQSMGGGTSSSGIDLSDVDVPIGRGISSQDLNGLGESWYQAAPKRNFLYDTPWLSMGRR